LDANALAATGLVRRAEPCPAVEPGKAAITTAVAVRVPAVVRHLLPMVSSLYLL
jgi:hypothetical protein